MLIKYFKIINVYTNNVDHVLKNNEYFYIMYNKF